MSDRVYPWQVESSTRRGRPVFFVMRRVGARGRNYYGGGTTAQRVSVYRSHDAAKAVADRLNREGSK